MSYYGNVYREPPHPTQGRRFVPIEAPPVADSPPPRNNVLAMAAIMVCWQAVVPQPIYQNVLTEAAAASSAANPTYKRQPESIRQSWEPDSQPVQRMVAITPLTFVYGDQPPPLNRVLEIGIRAAWELPDVPIIQRPFTPIVAPAAEVDDPPPKIDFLPTILASWYQPNLIHLWSIGLAESVTYTPDKPPPLKRQPLPAVEYQHPQQRQTTTPIVAAVVVGDVVQFCRQPASILAAWYEPQIVRVSLPSAPVEEEEPPPPLKRQQPPSVSYEHPQQRRVTAPIESVSVAAKVPYTRQPESILSSWATGTSVRQRRVLRTPPSVGGTFGIGQAQEIDTALPVGKIIGRVLETDTALPLSPEKTREIGLAIEIDSALSCTSKKTRAIGQAQETDSALALTAEKTRTIGSTSETDSALPVTYARGAIIGIAVEIDTAITVIPIGGSMHHLKGYIVVRPVLSGSITQKPALSGETPIKPALSGTIVKS